MRDESDGAQHSKLKEVALRLKDEHKRRVQAEGDLKMVRAPCAATGCLCRML